MGMKLSLFDPGKIEITLLKQASCSAETIRRNLQEVFNDEIGEYFPANHVSLSLSYQNKLQVYHYLCHIVLELIVSAKKSPHHHKHGASVLNKTKVYLQSGQLACCRASRTTPFSRRSTTITQPAQPSQQEAILCCAPHLQPAVAGMQSKVPFRCCIGALGTSKHKVKGGGIFDLTPWLVDATKIHRVQIFSVGQDVVHQC